MEVRPGYKQTEVGVIPEDWEVSKLAKNTTFKTGPFGSALHQSDYVESGVPVINPMQIMDGKIVPTPSMAVTEAAARKLSEFLLSAGDLIIGRRGEMGRCAMVRPEQHGWLCGTGSMIIRTGPSVEGRFVRCVLSSPPVIAAIENASVGSTMINLNQATLGNLLVSLPPSLAEQEAIAEALSDADALIESLEQLIAKRRHLKQGAMQELLTGKKRLSVVEGKASYKQTEVGRRIPLDWRVAKLSQVCSMKSGEGITSAKVDEFSKYPCYGGNGLRGFTTSFTHDGSYALIGRQGALCGNVLGVDGKFFASEHAVVAAASDGTDIHWLTFVLGQMRLNRYSESSAQPGLSVAKLLSLQVALPPTKAEQTAIATILSDMDAEIAALEDKLAKTRNIKQGMMQELLIGRIRLV